MLLAVLARRKLPRERVADQRLRSSAAQLRLAGHRISAELCRKRTVRVGLMVETPAKLERRHIRIGFARQVRRRGPLGNIRVIARQKSHAEILFEELVHAVQRSPGPTAGNGEVLLRDPYPKPFLAKVVRFDPGGALLQRFARADEDVFRRTFRRFDNIELGAAHFLEQSLEFLRRVSLTGNRVGRDHDRPLLDVAGFQNGNIRILRHRGRRNRHQRQNRHHQFEHRPSSLLHIPRFVRLTSQSAVMGVNVHLLVFLRNRGFSLQRSLRNRGHEIPTNGSSVYPPRFAKAKKPVAALLGNRRQPLTDSRVAFPAPLGHQHDVTRRLVVMKKRILSAVSLLGHVVRHVRYDHSRTLAGRATGQFC